RAIRSPSPAPAAGPRSTPMPPASASDRGTAGDGARSCRGRFRFGAGTAGIVEDLDGFLDHVQADQGADDVIRVRGGEPEYQYTGQDDADVGHHVGAGEQPGGTQVDLARLQRGKQ